MDRFHGKISGKQRECRDLARARGGRSELEHQPGEPGYPLSRSPLQSDWRARELNSADILNFFGQLTRSTLAALALVSRAGVLRTGRTTPPAAFHPFVSQGRTPCRD